MISSYFSITKIAFSERNYHVLHLRDIYSSEYYVAKGVLYSPKIGNVYQFDLETRKSTTSKGDKSFVISKYSLLTREHLEENKDLLDVFFSSFLEDEYVNNVTEGLIEHFGNEIPDILLYSIEKLNETFELLKVPKETTEIYLSLFRLEYIRPSAFAFLNRLLVKEDRSHLVLERYGYNFFKEIKRNPYILSILGGIPVKVVDALPLSSDIHPDSDQRFAGYMCNFSDQESLSKGHMYVFEKDLRAYLSRYSLKGVQSQSTSRINRVMDELEKDEFIRRDLQDGKKIFSTEYSFLIESTITNRVVEMVKDPGVIKFDSKDVLEKFNLLYSIDPTESQRSVLDNINGSDIMVLTGKAGTGKTTAVNLIICMLEYCSVPYALLSTTGKASKVLSRSTDREAQTVHSYLGFNGYGFTKHCPEERFLVVDEASMMDSHLAYGLLSCINRGTKVLLVGDNNQLPPVGPGGILDVMCDLEEVPVVELDIVHRQKAGSEILNQALRVLGKRSFQNKNTSPDYRFIQSDDSEYIKNSILSIVKHTREQGKECLVLSPMRKGSAGVVSINKFLQAKLNRNSLSEHSNWFKNDNYEFFEGDRIIITRNDWKLGICNGDIGNISSITDEYVSMRLDSGEDIVMSINKSSYFLELAYCLTVHKSQGSEYEIVCVVLQKDHQRMLSTNLIYTAFTRSFGKLLVFSDEFSRKHRTNESGKRAVKNSWVRKLFPEVLKTVA